MAKKVIIELLQKYISLLRSEGINIEKAFLYGSYASNQNTDESDIDLMIVTENDSDDFLVGKIWSLTRRVNSRIEPFLVGKNRFNSNDNSPLIEMVKEIFLKRKDLFHSGNKIEFNHGELLSSENISALWTKLINKECRRLQNQGFIEVKKYYRNNFNIDFNNFKDEIGYIDRQVL